MASKLSKNENIFAARTSAQSGLSNIENAIGDLWKRIEDQSIEIEESTTKLALKSAQVEDLIRANAAIQSKLDKTIRILS